MDNYKDLNNDQEDFLTVGEDCGLKVVNTNAEDIRKIFSGSEEAFQKFEDLGMFNPFIMPDLSEHNSDEDFFCE